MEKLNNSKTDDNNSPIFTRAFEALPAEAMSASPTNWLPKSKATDRTNKSRRQGWVVVRLITMTASLRRSMTIG